MVISEEQLARWAKAPSETEESKCQNAVGEVRSAIDARFGDAVSVFLQGSYKNRTNVRLDSDVDIVVRHNDYYFPNIYGLSESDKQVFNASFVESNYTFAQFKNDIQQTLINAFNYNEVERKKKCIFIKSDYERVDADVVPCFGLKRYKTIDSVEVEGIAFLPDGELRIESFPKQHYDNGVKKNDSTRQVYKSLVRILKNIRNNMLDQKLITNELMPSFFLECLVWNVSDEHFNKSTYKAALRAIVATIWNDMGDSEKANEYAEVSDLKWLFKGDQNRDPQQVRGFMQKVWDTVGYEN